MNSTEWKMWREEWGMFQVLQHPCGARAYFSESRIGDLLLREGLPRLPQNPFMALAWMIDRGLRPYKVEGDMPIGALPARANIDLELLAQTRLLDGSR